MSDVGSYKQWVPLVDGVPTLSKTSSRWFRDVGRESEVSPTRPSSYANRVNTCRQGLALLITAIQMWKNRGLWTATICALAKP